MKYFIISYDILFIIMKIFLMTIIMIHVIHDVYQI